jgi:RNA polymerase sigma factor (sigma-70 family)
VEVSALNHAGAAGIHGRSPLLRLQSDERLVALTRRGSHHAFEALVARYESRLLAFCRHMLASREDAEDVLQEVFAAAFNAMMADERPINVRPWLYRIARNRSLNHLRRSQAVGVDSMDIHLAEGGLTTADKVHRREEFRLLISDVQELPETQKTALLLREIDALSYDQIAEAMETTVPSVKSLLVRARVSLAEASEARGLSCAQVRTELGEVAEGLTRTTAPVRRHLRSCERCQFFRKQLRSTNRALAAVFPVGPLLLFKKLVLTHLGTSAAAGGGAAAASGGGTVAGVAAGGAVQAGMQAVATKAAAGLATAAIVTAGAVEVKHVAVDSRGNAGTAVSSVRTTPAPSKVEQLPVTALTPAQTSPQREALGGLAAGSPSPQSKSESRTPAPAAKPEAITKQTAPVPPPVETTSAPTVAGNGVVTPAPPVITQTESDTTTLPTAPTPSPTPPSGALGQPSPSPSAPSVPVRSAPAPSEPVRPPVPVPAPVPAPEPAPEPRSAPVVEAEAVPDLEPVEVVPEVEAPQPDAAPAPPVLP